MWFGIRYTFIVQIENILSNLPLNSNQNKNVVCSIERSPFWDAPLLCASKGSSWITSIKCSDIRWSHRTKANWLTREREKAASHTNDKSYNLESILLCTVDMRIKEPCQSHLVVYVNRICFAHLNERKKDISNGT